MRPARERRYLVAAGFSVLALSPSFVPLPVSWTPEGDVTVWLPQRSLILVPLCDRVW